MKLFVTSLLASVSAVVLADASPDWLNIAFNGGAFGLLAYLVVWGLPALYAEIRKDRQDDRAIQQMAMTTLQAQLKEQREHDAAQSQYEREQSDKHFGNLIHVVEGNQQTTMQTLSELGKTLTALATVISRQNRETDQGMRQQEKMDQDQEP